MPGFKRYALHYLLARGLGIVATAVLFKEPQIYAYEPPMNRPPPYPQTSPGFSAQDYFEYTYGWPPKKITPRQL